MRIKFFNKTFHIKKRSIILMLAYLVSTAGLVAYIGNLYVKWGIDPDIGINEKLIATYDLPAPAVTICSPLAMKPELVNSTNYFLHYNEKRGKTENDRINLTVSEQNYLAAIVQVCGIYFSSNKIIADDTKKRNNKNIAKLLIDGSLSINDTFERCALRYERFNCEEKIIKTLSDDGICYSYNMVDFAEIFNENVISSDFEVYKIKNLEMRNIWSLANGYKTEIDTTPYRAVPTNSMKFLPSINESNTYDLCKSRRDGFKVIYHLPNEMPTIFHETDFIATNQRAIVHVTPQAHQMEKTLVKYTAEKRRCYYDGERKLQFFKAYTKAHCNLECLTNFTFKECGCVKFSMPRTQLTKVCDLMEMECYKNASTRWPKHDENSNQSIMPCDCYPPCRSISYSISSKFYAMTEHNSLVVRNFINSNSNYTKLFSQLHIKFLDFQVVEIESYGAYQLYHFIADCGGLFGLFLGLSFISIVKQFLNVIDNHAKNRDTNEDVERNCDVKTEAWAQRIATSQHDNEQEQLETEVQSRGLHSVFTNIEPSTMVEIAYFD